ncbi:nucleoside triphosphate pyrophosphatase [Cyanobacterium aponinum AL20118]|uniref:Nucleoside triphosphate pyrophosphatase n=1 Tax=Cyanobacterium aponinum AL20115 TaxID=3090662 RepID=A0AAF0ZJR0_9CHRO|nr:nucleoside triphosphate pyrophosphatase [Cyanobacterium aponinum]WPF89567.1 nucleoside triphosphate pyrophosphatase [Cyanobacterium aponinum AL20115]
MTPKFVLASASPARLKLLRMIGIEPIVHKSDYDESLINLPQPIDLVNTLAMKKAEVVAQNYHDSLILGCDSLLLVDGEIYGKPEDEEVAIARWQYMRGKMGRLYTGHGLIDTINNSQIVQCGVTDVYFADVTDEQIRAYVATGEPLKCAGCFALEGKGGVFIEKIEGCHSNVIGLSLPLLRKMLTELSYEISYFW